VWRIPAVEDASFPEKGEMPELFARTVDVGLALSGGGVRACSESLGVLQALHAAGLLQRVRYISSNSGSSWLNAAFSYLPEDIPLDTFLGGAPHGPVQLTLDVLDSPPERSFAHIAAGAHPTKRMMKDAVVGCCRQKTPLRAWNEAVTDAYLGPFGLSSATAVMSPPRGTEGHRRAAEGIANKDVKVMAMRNDAPYPIIIASRLERSLKPLCCGLPENGIWYPLEFTPLYSGTPLLDKDAVGGPIGGGVIESFGFGGSVPKGLPDSRTYVENGEKVDVTLKQWFPLAQAAGTSSAAPYVDVAARSVKEQRLLGGPVVHLWSPADTKSANNRDTPLADGGPTDNIALLSLLRRGVSRVIVQVAETVAVTDPEFMKHVWWPSLFGRAEVGMLNAKHSAHFLNSRSQVFDPSALDTVLAALREKAEKGLPPVAEQTLDVRQNLHCGVIGGYKVRVLWICAGVADSFRAALPEETRRQLEKKPRSKKGALALASMLVEDEDLDASFPFNTTFYGNYTPRLVQMLAENTAFNLTEGSGKALQEFFS